MLDTARCCSYILLHSTIASSIVLNPSRKRRDAKVEDCRDSIRGLDSLREPFEGREGAATSG